MAMDPAVSMLHGAEPEPDVVHRYSNSLSAYILQPLSSLSDQSLG